MNSRKRKAPSMSTSSLNSFNLLPHDCQLCIFKFLSQNELDQVVTVSKDWHDLRVNKSLPQTRIGIIHVRRTMNVNKLANFVSYFNTREPFTKIEIIIHDGKLQLSQQLPAVTHLCIYHCPQDMHRQVLRCCSHLESALWAMRANVFSGEISMIRVGFRRPSQHGIATLVEALEMNGNCRLIDFTGQGTLEKQSNLQELYLKDTKFFYLMGEPGELLLWRCKKKLQRVSIKGACVYASCSGSFSRVSDAELMQFVRTARKLKWFQSDLSPENVAILQKERPEIEFVS